MADGGGVIYACWVCCAPAEKICGRCRAARYCSRACQEAHWAAHKPDCRPGATLRVVREATGSELLMEYEPRPGDRHWITKGALRGLVAETGSARIPYLRRLEARLRGPAMTPQEWHDWCQSTLSTEQLARVSRECRAWLEAASGHRLPDLPS